MKIQNNVMNNLVLLFVKQPIAGLVKTRLAKKIGDKAATELYKCFVEDLLEKLKVNGFDFRICLWPPDPPEDIRNWLGTDYWPQEGDDLGQRMRNVFLRAFSNSEEKVVLIGSDIPDVPAEYLFESFDALENCDIVLGPCHDGGYYLIGLSKKVPEMIFEQIDWGAKNVYDQTLSKIKQLRLKLYELPKWFDIDTYEDLLQFQQRHKSSEALKTIKMIRQWQI
ncbi:MAG: hypothetical protein A2Y10_18335 [Planctomycetes bacterium GWF2_41_51]|nr:MAG: hypothetical protein A2Y10_18335 [Planctomycetes bacterium GWF2_41_51]HBG27932.1 glycosyltransferase [Phycisphaerales bacterium]